jgi:inhibitor of cysteine peptidase
MIFTIDKLGVKVLTHGFYWFSPLRKPFFSASLCLLFVVLCAFRSQGQPLILTLADNDKIVTVSRGSQISLQLPENSGSTGYIWSDKTLKNRIVTLQRTGYVSAHSSSLPGAKGTVVFTFTAQNSGRVVLHFVLERPWDTKGAPAQRFTITIRVQSSPEAKFIINI